MSLLNRVVCVVTWVLWVRWLRGSYFFVVYLGCLGQNIFYVGQHFTWVEHHFFKKYIYIKPISQKLKWFRRSKSFRKRNFLFTRYIFFGSPYVTRHYRMWLHLLQLLFGMPVSCSRQRVGPIVLKCSNILLIPCF